MTTTLPLTGEVFESKYRLDSILGEGGFARVYRATDIAVGREIAIKVLKPADGAAYDRAAARFLQEMKLVARLNGPNVARIFEYGRAANGLMYMVLELVGGRDLSDLLEEHPLDEDAAVKVMMQVLGALREAHVAGLLHRDVKPQNIRVYEYMGDPFRAKLLDFGIAKAHGSDVALTATGMVVGTPRFMAPEQLFGEPLGPTTDLFSLALVAYEMLTGKPLDHMKLLANGRGVGIGEDEPIRAPLRAVLNRMLARDSVDRFQSAEAVMTALEQLSTMETAAYESAPIRVPSGLVAPRQRAPAVPNRPRTAAGEENAQPRRILWVALATGAIGLLTVALAVGLSVSQKPDRPTPQPGRRALPSGLVRGSAPKQPAVEEHDGEADLGAQAVVTDGSGCNLPAPFVGTGVLSATDGLRSNKWLVHVPAYYDSSRRHSVVMLFHDDASTSTDILGYTRLAELADEHAFVVIAPTDTDLTFVWSGDDDIDTSKAALDGTAARLCLDLDHVWAVGHGSGSHAPDRLSCEDWIAGVAMSSYLITRPTFACAPSTPKPTIYFAPMNTDFQPPGGGVDCFGTRKISYDEFEALWARRNGCSKSKKGYFSYKESECFEWKCEHAPFVTCRVAGGRQWPGAPNRPTDLLGCDGVSPDFPQNDVLWKFIDGSN